MRGFLAAMTIATGAALMPGAAAAIDVKQSIELDDVKIPDAWAKVGGWCAIKDWHPAVAKCEESTEAGKQRRTLTLKDGGVIKETMTEKGESSYTYTIDESPLPVANYTATFFIVPDEDDEDEINVVWQAKFDAKGKTDKEAEDVIKGIFKAGLASIKKSMK